MSGIRTELTHGAAALDVAANAAMCSLGLVPGEFVRFSGETHQSPAPQIVIPDFGIALDSFGDKATVYGTPINTDSNSAYDHITAHIHEPIPDGSKHQSAPNLLPVPYMRRSLFAKYGIIAVHTPTTSPSLNAGPMVIEGNGRNPTYREITTYYGETGRVTVKGGQLICGRHIRTEDRTTEQDALELPDDILVPRLMALVRTIKATTAVLEKIAMLDAQSVSWQIQKASPE